MTKVETEVCVLIGEAYLRLGWPDKAIEHFEAAGSKESLLECGAKALEASFDIDVASRAYQAAGVEMPKDGLIACGTKLLERGQVERAREVFSAAVALEVEQPSS